MLKVNIKDKFSNINSIQLNYHENTYLNDNFVKLFNFSEFMTVV